MVERKVVTVPLGYPTTAIFVDESRARASGGRFFAVAALKVRDQGALARGMRHIRDQGSGFTGEFKFRAVTAGTLPRYYAAIDLLEASDAQVHACVVDAEQFNPFGRSKAFWQVHADIVSQLLVGAINKRELVTVLIDHISTPKHVAYDDRLKARVNKRLGSTSVIGAHCVDSKCTDLLQIADLIAGAIAYDRGLQVEKYKTTESDKKKLVVRLKGALGGVDLADGRTSRTNIETFRSSARVRQSNVHQIGRQRAG